MIADDFKPFTLLFWQADLELRVNIDNLSTIHADQVMMGCG